MQSSIARTSKQEMELVPYARRFLASGLGNALLSQGIILFLLSGLPGVAQANCLDEVRALFRDHLDTTKWPPYRSVVIIRSADGRIEAEANNIVEKPGRTIGSFSGGPYTLSVDGKFWTGPSPQGPWTSAPAINAPAQGEAHARMHAQQLANLRDVECPGEAQLDGRRVLIYIFSTRTDPDPAVGGHWFGGRAKVYLDPSTREVLRWDEFEAEGSFSMGDRKSTTEQTYIYDPTIRVNAP